MKPLHIALVLLGVGGLIYQFQSGIYGSPKKANPLPPLSPYPEDENPTTEVSNTNPPFQPPILEVPKIVKDSLTRGQKDELVTDWAEGGIKDLAAQKKFIAAFPTMTESERESVYLHLRDFILTGKKLPFLTKLYKQIHKITKKYKLAY